MGWELQDTGIVGLLAAVVMLLVREILQKRWGGDVPGRDADPYNHNAIHTMLKRLVNDHDDSDSKFSTVHVQQSITDLNGKVDILLERSAQILRERSGP